MSTLDTSQKADVLDENGNPLDSSLYEVSSTQPTIVAVDASGASIEAVAQSAGSGQLQARRLSDGEMAYLTVTVAPAPFSISLGTPEPK